MLRYIHVSHRMAKNATFFFHHMKSRVIDKYPLCFCVACLYQGAASGVRVNSVIPGHVETPIYGETPVEALVGVTGTTQLIPRLIQPEEVR